MSLSSFVHQEELDREFYPDWEGLELVGLWGVAKLKEEDLTNKDLEELTLWLDQDISIELRSKRLRVPFDFEQCYQLAEVGCSAVEAAQAMGVETYVIHNNIRARYGYGWKEYSAHATAALNGEVRLKMIEAIRGGDKRFLAMYATRFLGWDPTKKVELSGPGGGPMQQQAVMVTLSKDELDKRRQALASVVDRRSRFEELGQVSPTLELVNEESQ